MPLSEDAVGGNADHLDAEHERDSANSFGRSRRRGSGRSRACGDAWRSKNSGELYRTKESERVKRSSSFLTTARTSDGADLTERRRNDGAAAAELKLELGRRKLGFARAAAAVLVEGQGVIRGAIYRGGLGSWRAGPKESQSKAGGGRTRIRVRARRGEGEGPDKRAPHDRERKGEGGVTG